jgi:hypothetical protein
VVSQFLPLLTKIERRETAPTVYQDLVLDRTPDPTTYFPFAVDGGGDYLFTDTSTNHGAVYFYGSDADEGSECLADLELDLADFWKASTPG